MKLKEYLTEEMTADRYEKELEHQMKVLRNKISTRLKPEYRDLQTVKKREPTAELCSNLIGTLSNIFSKLKQLGIKF